MTEGEPHLPAKANVEFGQPRKQGKGQGVLFPDGADLPLFSGTPQQVRDQPFVPADHTYKQAMLPDMPELDYERIRQTDRERTRRRSPTRRRTGANPIFPELPEERTAR